MDRSLVACLVGTFTLRLSTGLTGALFAYYLADLPIRGGEPVSPLVYGVFGALFYAAELVLSPIFGLASDRLGHHRVMQVGPIFGAVAVVLTFAFVDLRVLGATRLLEGASTAASVPSILGYIAMVTAGNELLRGRASARFEGATLAGLGIGLVAAGILYKLIGPGAFLLNAGIYVGSYFLFRLGVTDPRADDVGPTDAPTGIGRYLRIVGTSHVWLLAPTWIAVNTALGLWTGQSIFLLVRPAPAHFADQALMGTFGPLQISLGTAAGLIIFLAGLAYWGERFRNTRRTTIIFYGILGGFAVALAAVFINHVLTLGPLPVLAALLVVGGGLFVLAGATPAALGLLADLSEGFPADRGAIMGLYSVFLGVGQIAGNLIGGVAGEARGIDGLLIATFALLVVALVPLYRLRIFEHEIGADAGPDLLGGSAT
jgi:MFS family permease